MEEVMPNEDDVATADEQPVSRRDSVRLAAALALGAALGVPSALLGAPNMVRMQWKVYKAPTDGGALVETVEFSDTLMTFVRSAAGQRAQLKWYADTGQEVLSMAMPRLYSGKI
jgi:hypothetical protein